MSAQLSDRRDGYVDLRSYAAIGNGRTVALIARDGSVDWFPVPDLDSAPVFARLLDAGHGGCIELQPDPQALAAAGVDVAADLQVHREYVAGTNVLRTTCTTPVGTVRVTDSLNMGSTGALPWTELARCVDGVEGQVPMAWRVRPGTMLNGASPWVQHTGQGPVVRVGGVSLAVRSEQAGAHDAGPQTISGRFTTGEGTAHLLAVVGTAAEPLRLPEPKAIRRNVGLSVDLWRRWTDLLEYDGPYPEEVRRSALVLKMLGHSPSGSIAAAATTSLPENREGTKNYDYRFAWIRDATYALHALLRLGEQEDVHAAVSWLLRLAREQSPRLHVLNRLNGELPETGTAELDVPGWRGIGPVVSGNDALDRAITLADGGHLPGTDDRWRDERDRVRAWIDEHGWSEERGAYIMYRGGDQLDASVLLHTISGFDTGPRMSATIDALREELGRGPLLYRYSGMPAEEGAFTACGFWCVAALTLNGQ
ncbi:glycoside hydrolase family 15 protein [Citricoccus sp. NPDC055426]|uniref:glycoside hydrolase family 15 protein n=1 Tax=Citricoccus sp. NPDC055426 TaxID=3155536 RepID=UPI0034402A82